MEPNGVGEDIACVLPFQDGFNVFSAIVHLKPGVPLGKSTGV